MPPTGMSVTVRVISRLSPEGMTVLPTLPAVAGAASRKTRMQRRTVLFGVTIREFGAL
jgi:hypothetical protein